MGHGCTRLRIRRKPSVGPCGRALEPPRVVQRPSAPYTSGMLARGAAIAAGLILGFLACSSEEDGEGSEFDGPGSSSGGTGDGTGGAVLDDGSVTFTGGTVGAGGTSAPGSGGGVTDAAVDQPTAYLVDGGCTAGETRTCQCDDGSWGLQSCNTHGTAYTPCDCSGGTQDAGECVPVGEPCAANPWCCEGSCNANAEGTFGIRCCFFSSCYGPGQCCNGTDCSGGQCCSETGGNCSDPTHCCNGTDDCVNGTCTP